MTESWIILISICIYFCSAGGFQFFSHFGTILVERFITSSSIWWTVEIWEWEQKKITGPDVLWMEIRIVPTPNILIILHKANRKTAKNENFFHLNSILHHIDAECGEETEFKSFFFKIIFLSQIPITWFYRMSWWLFVWCLMK